MNARSPRNWPLFVGSLIAILFTLLIVGPFVADMLHSFQQTEESLRA